MPKTGFKHSADSIKKMSTANKGKHFSPNTEFKKGNKLSPETKIKMGDARKGKNNPRWKGGKSKAGGYIQISSHMHPYADGRGYVREHRLIVEKQIGRYLLRSEIVHHLGKKNVNKPECLMAFKNHSAHVRFESGGLVKPDEIIFDGRLLMAGTR
jgi:hypothetical protein